MARTRPIRQTRRVALSFPTTLDRTPVDDTVCQYPVTWLARGESGLAHCYPSAEIHRRSHLCQGLYLSKLRDPMDPNGRTRLYNRATIRRFLDVSRGAYPVCASCLGVLYWFVGPQATDSVFAYRVQRLGEST